MRLLDSRRAHGHPAFTGDVPEPIAIAREDCTSDRVTHMATLDNPVSVHRRP